MSAEEFIIVNVTTKGCVMEDLQSILSSHPTRMDHFDSNPESKVATPSSSSIPDLFFDEVLVEFKLSRLEILTLMFLYRITWCKANLNVKYGIAPLISHKELSDRLGFKIEELLDAVKRLETYGFIETIRSGQYFVRKFFTESKDIRYGQTYDDFL